MYRGHTIGVVIPAYNEVGFVGDVIDTVPAYVDRVYAVDDRSTDGTWEEIRQHASAANRRRIAAGAGNAGEGNVGDGQGSERTEGEYAELTVDGGQAFEQPVVAVQHDENRGVGGAIKTGYRRALDDGVDITAVLAGDGQMDPEFLTRLLDPIVEGKAGYAKGNRLLNEEYRRGMSRWRFTGNAILSFLTKVASGYWKTMDPQNGYTAISRDALERVDIEEMYEYYGYCNDLLTKLNVAEVRVADVPIPAVYGEEESSIRYTHYVRKVSLLLVRNFLWRLKTRYLVRDFHPLALFYATGAFAAVLGLVSGLRSLLATVGPDRGGSEHATAASGLGDSLALLGVGWVLALFAMAFDMRENEELEVQLYE